MLHIGNRIGFRHLGAAFEIFDLLVAEYFVVVRIIAGIVVEAEPAGRALAVGIGSALGDNIVIDSKIQVPYWFQIALVDVPLAELVSYIQCQ